MDVGRPGKSGACWRDSTKGKGFAGRSTPTCLCPSIGKQKYRPQNERLRSAFLFSIRLLRLRAKLTRLRAAFATPVALLLFCPIVAMLHPLHSPRSRGGTPVPLFPLQNYLRLLRSSLVLTRLHNRDFLRRNSEATHIPEQLPTLLFSTR